jgi:site-specific DNA-methyltransferase (adenine-specific)
MLLQGDCLDRLKDLEDNSVDSIVTDPPYGLSFMNKKWDYDVPATEIWEECLRVLKPGGHLLSFSSARTYHRMVVNVEDAGFEIRDQIMWVYGSGFPKNHNIGKKVPEYEGWGTALKPAHEPIVMARKPLTESSIAKNVLRWGTGGINIDKSKVGERFPANFIHDGSQEVLDLFPEKAGALFSAKRTVANDGGTGYTIKGTKGVVGASNGAIDEPGSAARFFYCAKAGKKEKDAGCEHLPTRRPDVRTSKGMGSFEEKGVQPGKNFHPTVKPIKLMTYLINLVTPLEGTVLDPFMGSGSTGVACKTTGNPFIGIEKDPEYYTLAQTRIN